LLGTVGAWGERSRSPAALHGPVHEAGCLGYLPHIARLVRPVGLGPCSPMSARARRWRRGPTLVPTAWWALADLERIRASADCLDPQGLIATRSQPVGPRLATHRTIQPSL
jgi:hypothetical protein